MGRLISEDNVMRMLTSVELNNGTITDAKSELRNVKTAYDVEKVVEEFESAENYYYDDALDAECNLISFKSIRQDVAIDIVRDGGIE